MTASMSGPVWLVRPEVAALMPYQMLQQPRPRVLGLLRGDFALSDEEFLSA